MELFKTYGRAWENRDPELIDTVFTADAQFTEPGATVASGATAIKQYWQNKVVEGQKDIVFLLRGVWIDGNTVFARWLVSFTDTKRNLRIELDEVCLSHLRDSKICMHREYYHSTKTPL